MGSRPKGPASAELIHPFAPQTTLLTAKLKADGISSGEGKCFTFLDLFDPLLRGRGSARYQILYKLRFLGMIAPAQSTTTLEAICFSPAAYHSGDRSGFYVTWIWNSPTMGSAELPTGRPIIQDANSWCDPGRTSHSLRKGDLPCSRGVIRRSAVRDFGAAGCACHDQLAFRSTSSTASGCLAMTASSTRVGASGRDRPCSQLRSVAGGKPNFVANCA